MMPADWIAAAQRAAYEDEVAVVFCREAFTFEAGSRMRSAKCLVCDEPIGGRQAAVVGVAAVNGAPCLCGGIVSDVFLMHLDHMPINQATFEAAINRSLKCDLDHQQP